MKIKQYMVTVYAVLVKSGKHNIEELPEAYIIPVAEYLAEQEEGSLRLIAPPSKGGHKKSPRGEGFPPLWGPLDKLLFCITCPLEMGRVMQARNSRKYFSDVVIFFSIMLSAFLKNVEPLQHRS